MCWHFHHHAFTLIVFYGMLLIRAVYSQTTGSGIGQATSTVSQANDSSTGTHLTSSHSPANGSSVSYTQTHTSSQHNPDRNTTQVEENGTASRLSSVSDADGWTSVVTGTTGTAYPDDISETRFKPGPDTTVVAISSAIGIMVCLFIMTLIALLVVKRKDKGKDTDIEVIEKDLKEGKRHKKHHKKDKGGEAASPGKNQLNPQKLGEPSNTAADKTKDTELKLTDEETSSRSARLSLEYKKLKLTAKDPLGPISIDAVTPHSVLVPDDVTARLDLASTEDQQ